MIELNFDVSSDLFRFLVSAQHTGEYILLGNSFYIANDVHETGDQTTVLLQPVCPETRNSVDDTQTISDPLLKIDRSLLNHEGRKKQVKLRNTTYVSQQIEQMVTESMEKMCAELKDLLNQV